MGKPLKRFKDWNRRRRTQLKLGVNERCAGRGAGEATPDLVVGIFCAMEIMWAAALVWGAASRDGRSPIRSGNPGLEAIEGDRADDVPLALYLNYRGFLGSCGRIEFLFGKDVFEMEGDIVGGTLI